MPGSAVRASSSTPSFSCRSRSIPPPTVPVPSAPCPPLSLIRRMASSRGCWIWKAGVDSSAAMGSSDFSMCRAMPLAAMPIERIELYELSLPLVEPFIISGGTITERRSLVVVLHDQDGHRGYGESPPFELPVYSEETLASARYMREQVLIPRLLQSGVELPADVDQIVRRGVRGNPFARAALETAAWDLDAARKGVGLARLLAERV